MTSIVDAGVLDRNISHARKKAKEMVERKLRSMVPKRMNKLQTCFFFEALKLDPENDEQFHDFVKLLK